MPNLAWISKGALLQVPPKFGKIDVVREFAHAVGFAAAM